MQIVTMYKTVDGLLFDCEIKATKHEKHIEAVTMLVGNADIYSEQASDVLHCIRNNKDVFIYLFD